MNVKVTTLGVLSVALAALFAYFFSAFLGGSSPNAAWYALGAAVLWLVFVVFQVFFVSDIIPASFIIFFETVAFGLFTWHIGTTVMSLAALVLLAAFLWWSHTAGANEMNNAFKLHFYKIAMPAAARASTALALFLAVIYVGSINLKDPTASKRVLENVFKPAEPIIARIIPGFKFNDTLGGILTKSSPVKPEAPGTITAQVNQMIDTLEKAIGVRAAQADQIIDILYKATIGRLLTLSKNMQTLILLGVGLLLFLTVKGLLFIVNWVVLLIVYIAMKVLQATGFYKISLENRSKEVVVLD